MLTKPELEHLIADHLSIRQIAERLETSFTNVRYWLRKHGLNTSTKSPTNNAQCAVCAGRLKGKQTKFCSAKCKSAFFKSTKNYTYKSQQARALARKRKLVELKGGKCCRCNYSKNLAALCFHHREPENKLFNIDARKCSNTNWESLLKEVQKCDLLCHNCHNELHYPNLAID